MLTRESRAALLAAVPPRLARVYADHVTVLHGPSAEALGPGLLACVGGRVRLAVTRELCDGNVQAVAVGWAGDAGDGSGGGDDDEEGGGDDEEGGSGSDDDDDSDGSGGDRGNGDNGMRGGWPDPPASPYASVPVVEEAGWEAGDDGGGGEAGSVQAAVAAAVRVAGGGGRGLRRESGRGGGASAGAGVARMSTNPLPHITLSARPGVAPATANALLSRAARQGGWRGAAHAAPPLAVLDARLGLCVSRVGGGRAFIVGQRALRAWAEAQGAVAPLTG